ncbi:hypothetical protein PVNG_02469 [Plasmodium vivax North Korean]|uniref:UvrD-like helicase ATP-binding domain-containing protein n=1 Tax=Plasmodium vivax North Korean TaxID=1035514 RepID=A0A0J9TMH4_PLAVI|nr:hypothetical protein PVNG_02469 [Plasmodium vivax North Korean]
MMGNFSVGGYFREKAIEYASEFLLVKLALDPQRLVITVHESDNHIRTLVILLGEDLSPSNKGRGYVLRKLLRRVFTSLYILEVKDTKSAVVSLSEKALNSLKEFYPELNGKFLEMQFKVAEEYNSFRKIITTLETKLSRVDVQKGSIEEKIFTLVERDGLPLPVIEVYLHRKNIDFSVEKQLNAIRFSERRNVGIIAGPGSGKTFVIIERIRFYLSRRIEPRKILLVTYTNRGIIEIKKRISKFVRAKKEFEYAGTLHALCKKFLEEELRGEFEELIGIKVNKKIGRLVWLKKEKVARILKEVFLSYQNSLEKREMFDFDDLIIYFHYLTYRGGKSRRLIQNKFEQILVDEFQDMNFLQLLIISEISGSKRNIFFVGDPNQAIYGFQGAYPEIFRYFKTHIDPTTVFFNLSQNYRSSQNIIDLSHKLITHNPQKDILNKMFTENDKGPLVS